MPKFTIAVLAIIFLPLVVYGATIHVPGDYPTIQAGINASSNGDTVLVASGTYTGTGNKNLDFGGRRIVVMSEGGPASCTIDCQSSGRGAYFHSGESSLSVLQGFTIKSGSSTNGGGVNITNSSPTIKRCIIWSCSSLGSYGAGIYISNGSPLIIHCTIAQNSAWKGGAMYATNASMTVNSCIVVNNTATG